MFGLEDDLSNEIQALKEVLRDVLDVLCDIDDPEELTTVGKAVLKRAQEQLKYDTFTMRQKETADAQLKLHGKQGTSRESNSRDEQG